MTGKWPILEPANGVAPPDELDRVIEDADFGWSHGFGQQQPPFNCRAIITGLQNPQHWLVLPHGDLLISDFSAGVIYWIRRSGAAN